MDPGPTILIVDDYRDALDVWSLYLRWQGFAVLTASDGIAALHCATTALPDLALLDLELPGRHGCDVARELRAEPSTRDIPLIAVTGNSGSARLAAARDAGFDTVLVKPCDPPALVCEIRRLLEERPRPDGGQTAV